MSIEVNLARCVVHPDSRSSFSLVCGMRTQWVRATTPLARLSIFPWGIRLGGRNRVFGLLMFSWEARFDELAPVRPIVFGKFRRGGCIRFLIADDTNQWAICGTSRIIAVLDAIEVVGGPVRREPVRVHRMDPAREYTES
ncbi:MAG: hypothetical protein ACYDGY_10065 [Acidimicrobiales bacterium]